MPTRTVTVGSASGPTGSGPGAGRRIDAGHERWRWFRHGGPGELQLQLYAGFDVAQRGGAGGLPPAALLGAVQQPGGVVAAAWFVVREPPGGHGPFPRPRVEPRFQLVLAA